MHLTFHERSVNYVYHPNYVQQNVFKTKVLILKFKRIVQNDEKVPSIEIIFPEFFILKCLMQNVNISYAEISGKKIKRRKVTFISN